MLKQNNQMQQQYKFLLLGIMSSLFALISISALFIVDYEYIYIAPLVIYTLLIIVETTNKIYSGITISLWLIYFTFFVLNMFNINYFNYYIGFVVYFTLFCVFFIGLIFKKYVTSVYDYTRSGSYHKITSIMWVCVYLVSLISSYLLIPNLLYIILPLSIVCLACLITIYNGMFGIYPMLGLKYRFSGHFLNQDVTFDVCNTNNLTHVELINQFMITEFAQGDSYYLNKAKTSGFNIIYAYTKNNKDVNIIATLILNLADKITLSNTQICDFSAVNNKLKFAQIDDLIIAKEFRNSPDILLYLFIKALELSMVNGIKMLITFSVKETIAMFNKIGFDKLPDRVIDKVNTYETMVVNKAKSDTRALYPMVYNLSKAVVNSSPQDEDVKIYREILNKNILEYYVKRNYFSPLYLKWQSRSFNLTTQEINDIIDKYHGLVLK